LASLAFALNRLRAALRRLGHLFQLCVMAAGFGIGIAAFGTGIGRAWP